MTSRDGGSAESISSKRSRVATVWAAAVSTSSHDTCPSSSAARRCWARIIRHGISMSSPPCNDAAASRMPNTQSLMTNPWKPHSSRRTSVSSGRLCPHHSPFTELYTLMIDATPSSTIRLKWGRYTSCSATSSTSMSTVKRAFSIELQAKCFALAITCCWRPRVNAAPCSPTWNGSSP